MNPTGDAAASVIALRDGATAATGFTAQLDTNGDINLLATADVDVAVDITGYYRAPNPWVPALNYWPTDAVLAADSTTGTGTCDGITCATLTAGDHDVLVAGVGAVPATDVAAVTVSISTGTTGAAGSLRAAPNGDASAGSLAWDTTFPNAAGQFTVPVNGDGTITVEVDTATDIGVSVTGWWATPESATDTGTGLVLVDDGPVRLVDTAEGIGSCDGDPCATLVGNDPPVQVDVAGQAGLDEDVVAVMVSVTVHDPTGPGLVGLGANATDLSALMVFDDTAHTAAIIPVDAETGTISMASWTNVDVTIDVIGGFTRPTTTYRYEYDSAGLRTAKEREGTGGWRDEFTWTAHGGLPLLLAEHRGTDTSYLVYGPGGTPIYQVTKTGSVMYFHQDHQGSTRLVTNANGTVRGTLDYDTYGQITANTVPWLYEQPLATYTGEYTDTETGFIYLRARHYDPATGQFTTLDPLVAMTEEPYGYTNGNPANGSDPTGLGCNPLEVAKEVFTGQIFGPRPCGRERQVIDRAGQEVQRAFDLVIEHGPEATVKICAFYGCVEARASLKNGIGARAGAGLAVGYGVTVGPPGEKSCEPGTSHMFSEVSAYGIVVGAEGNKGPDEDGWNTDVKAGYDPLATENRGVDVSAGMVRWDWQWNW